MLQHSSFSPQNDFLRMPKFTYISHINSMTDIIKFPHKIQHAILPIRLKKFKKIIAVVTTVPMPITLARVINQFCVSDYILDNWGLIPGSDFSSGGTFPMYNT